MHKRLLSLALLLCCSLAASASPMVYHVTVDTTALSGTTGAIDFNFNPGPLVTQAASVQVNGFSSDGAAPGPGVVTGNASGTLSGGINLTNGTPFNDYFTAFTYGSTMGFDISLFGPALSTPDGTSSSGSTFVFSLFSDAAGTLPALTTDGVNGFGYVVNVNLDGSTTATSYLSSTNPQPPSTVPEPSSLVLLGTGLSLGAARLWGRRPQRV